MKFFFGDKVKVVSGFYYGIEGVITDYKRSAFADACDDYYFEGFFNNENLMMAREIKTWITEQELKKVEE